ncbi:MAG: hypothetical protein JWR61_4512 [Ferruginibacter sp.]|uniref:outer membrane beta-barrel protein n=1 Tax=Ferruginibacter sp. TaxID=1940288 RepID=UPI00265A3DBE|nr:outer membrane beta-barrel protein [Ferruginibacter sp.]MDB5279557.1 hypothetical protein [Ferruginibacter sp.]
MSKRLHNSDELFDSPQYGWEELKVLLDKNLPVRRKSNFSMVRAGVAASLTALLLLSSLLTHDNYLQLVPQNNYLVKTIENKEPGTSKAEQQVMSPVRKFSVKKPFIHDAANNNSAEMKVNENTINPQMLPEGEVPDLVGIDHADLEKEDYLSLENPFSKSRHLIRPLPIGSGNMQLSGKAVNEMQHKNKLLFSAGVDVNVIPGQRQNLQPFPAAEMLYKASPNFYVSMGLTAGAVVATSGHGVSKTIYVNDTANNIQFYNKVTSYTRLYYADIPVMAGVKLGKRLSAEGGVQASILLGTKSKESIDKYDFQMRQANVPQNTFMGAAAAAPENNYKVSPLKMDYRLVGGLRYSMNKVALDLTYQYALRPAFEGKQVTAARNQLLTFKIFYHLK